MPHHPHTGLLRNNDRWETRTLTLRRSHTALRQATACLPFVLVSVLRALRIRGCTLWRIVCGISVSPLSGKREGKKIRFYGIPTTSFSHGRCCYLALRRGIIKRDTMSNPTSFFSFDNKMSDDDKRKNSSPRDAETAVIRRHLRAKTNAHVRVVSTRYYSRTSMTVGLELSRVSHSFGSSDCKNHVKSIRILDTFDTRRYAHVQATSKSHCPCFDVKGDDNRDKETRLHIAVCYHTTNRYR